MDGILIRLCGAMAVTRGGTEVAIPGRKARLLLARLAAASGSVVAGDLVEDLWPDRPPASPSDNIATLVSRLRSALGPEVVTGGRAGYRIGGPPAVRVDVVEARALATDSGRHLRAGAPALALAAADRGVALLDGGRALTGEPDAVWVEALRAEAAEVLRDLRHLVAEAGPAVGDHASGVAAARAAADADPLDERAHRLLMAAHRSAGEQDRALAVYARLRSALAESLGVDPDERTHALYLAILRHTPARAAPPSSEPVRRPVPPGRDGEIAELTEMWSAATRGRAGAALLAGEAGIGKTTLAEAVARLAEQTAGRVLRARCYDAERSLFLQPVLDALDPLLRSLPADRARRLAGTGAGALAALVPEAAAVLGEPAADLADPEAGRRRAYDAVRSLLLSLAAEQPVLLMIDDLHNAGVATVELLHYVLRRASSARLLVLATVRSEEGADVLATLGEVAGRVDVAVLAASAVSLLAARAGVPQHAEDVLRRTGGHTLFVVESLRALAAGEAGVPESLQGAVASRLRHVDDDAQRVLRAGAVLGAAVEPDLVAALLDLPRPEAIRLCEHAAAARMLVPAGAGYEFTNDLLHEALYTSTPEPTRIAHHRRAVELLADRPESLARHAEALGDLHRAASAWLAAGERAAWRCATADAASLLDRAVLAVAGVNDPALAGRVHLARSWVREVLARYPGAVDDLRVAGASFRASGERRMEVAVVRRFAGQLCTALPIDELVRRFEAGSRIAEELDDPGAQAELHGGRAVLAANRLDFPAALRFARLAVAAGRAAGSDEALAYGLDGLKTAHAYLGETGLLAPVLDELVPILDRLEWLEFRCWAAFEGAIPAVAAADWDTAAGRIDAAIRIRERSGIRSMDPWLAAHRGWLDRLRGRHTDAVDRGRSAVAAARAAPHDWWLPVANALLATTLIETGEPDEAAALLVEGCAAARRGGAEAYLLRCVAPLAELTGDDDALDEADALLSGIRAPEGSAWLAGGDAYLSVARAWRNRGEARRALVVLRSLLEPAERLRWVPWQAAGALEQARALSDLGEHAAAVDRRDHARALAEHHDMPSLATAAGTTAARPA
ncbi:ATP-binding protein [Pseudonocardia endophytica]|uniref:Transcriptional activator n=1 Tax=Pseudonocardia endophytica TaxID=401976 RepID=A0A4R1HWZ6_PSEEN|nr:AAA family ATPase [Pseudonocardia endophytica]TCK27267.1 transcriptional activator [Pseudonocardia endophytica]